MTFHMPDVDSPVLRHILRKVILVAKCIAWKTCLGLKWAKALFLLVLFIGFSMMIVVFPFAFIFDLAFKATDTAVQSPRWSDFLAGIVVLTAGGVAALVAVITLLERLLGSEPFFKDT